MTLTPSNMLALGTEAPDFHLRDAISGNWYGRDQLVKARGLLVMFICNHCPYVRHLETALVALGAEYADSEIGIAAICANDADAYPEDHPQFMAEKGYPFPYLHDSTQEVARAYQAACTPDFFLFDRDLRCVYRGQFDNSRPGSDLPISGHDLRQAMEALLVGASIDPDQKPSIGCNIKWRG